MSAVGDPLNNSQLNNANSSATVELENTLSWAEVSGHVNNKQKGNVSSVNNTLSMQNESVNANQPGIFVQLSQLMLQKKVVKCHRLQM